MSSNQKGVIYAKGKRGLIYISEYKRRKIVIKTKNPKSKAIGRIEIEAEFLKKLNKYGIGPKFLFFKNGELGMKLVEGDFFQDFIEKTDKKEIKKVIIKIFKQLYQMDKLGINKEEMHRPVKHIIVDKKNNPVLIDFERCHYVLKPSNITQFVQFLSKEGLKNKLELKKIKINQKILDAAKKYKKDMNLRNLKKIISMIS